MDELASRDDEAASIEAAGPSATEIGGGCVALSPISAERSKAPIKIKAACDVREPGVVIFERIIIANVSVRC